MTDLEIFLKTMQELGIKYDVLANRMVVIKGLYWVFDKDGRFEYLEDPDSFKREYPIFRKDVTIH